MLLIAEPSSLQPKVHVSRKFKYKVTEFFWVIISQKLLATVLKFIICLIGLNSTTLTGG